MDDFSTKPGSANNYGLIGGEINSIQPEKRMLSSMTPTIIEKNGKKYGGFYTQEDIKEIIDELLNFECKINVI